MQAEPPELVLHFGDGIYAADSDDGAVIMGRERPADIVLSDPRVSRTHLRLEPRDGEWIAVDVSLNGIFLDGEPHGSIAVDDGMTIQLGDPEGTPVTFTFAEPSSQHAGRHRDPSADSADGNDDTWIEQDRTNASIARTGAAVAARREELDLTQRSLARNKVINAGALIAFEKGRAWPRKQTLARLEEALHWSPGTITRLRHRKTHAVGDNTDVLSNTVHAPLLAEAVGLALGTIPTAIESLPAPTDPAFGGRASEILADLRRLEAVAANAARTATGAPEVAMALSGVRRCYHDLMLTAARGPRATLGQRLYAARRSAELTAGEAANAAGVPAQTVDLVEADGALDADDAAAIEALIATLANR